MYAMEEKSYSTFVEGGVLTQNLLTHSSELNDAENDKLRSYINTICIPIEE